MSEPDLGLDSGEKDLINLADGTVLSTHGPAHCLGDHCCIHNPSQHALRAAPMVWAQEMRLMFRRCEHDALHPDPDAMEFSNVMALMTGSGWYDGWHPCCPQQCCRQVQEPLVDDLI